MNQFNLLVYTDMDGSLLDHYTYSHAPADRLLAELESKNIPVIPNTSKTRAELEQLRRELENSHPFIAENGAAIFLPKSRFPQQPQGTFEDGNYWVKSFVQPRQHWQMLIAELEPAFRDSFVTFAQAGLDGIVKMTGLDKDSAELSAQREYGEPVKWLGSNNDKKAFFAQLEAKGAHILHGGRFSHVSGQCDKGIALNWLKDCYERDFNQGKPLQTLALGDSQNDAAMLNAADYAVVIKSPTHSAPSLLAEKDRVAKGHLYYSLETGPSGWEEGVEQVLRKRESETD